MVDAPRPTDDGVERWTLGANLRADVIAAMSTRVRGEMALVDQGIELHDAHGEAVAAFSSHLEKIDIGLRILRANGFRFGGTTADIGSGTGVGATILSRLVDVRRVYAIDYSDAMVTLTMPAVFRRYGAIQEKITRVVGDFNAMALPDQHLDGAVEINSLHHSEDLAATLHEIRRVLKPGAFLLSLERAWPDDVSDAFLESRLQSELPSHLRQKYAIEEGRAFTREMWGEHEYRRTDWLRAFRRAGFDACLLRQVHPRWRGLGLNSALNALSAQTASVRIGGLAYGLGFRRLVVYGLHADTPLFLCRRRR